MKYVLSFCPEWPKCQKVPRIDILEDNKQIMIRCDCGFDKVLSLDEYLQKLPYEEGNVVPLSCPEISDAKELISEAEEHINTYLEEMMNEALKGTKKDKKVKEAYDECKNRCENVVTLVKLFTLNYFKQNEQMIKNIVNNSTFNIRKWELSDQESTIEYFNTYCIFIPEDNTDYNFIDTKTQFPSHQETINGLFKLNDERIAIYSNEKTIELLDPLNNFNVDIVIKGHPSGVLSMDQFDNDLVVSCSNSSIMLWSLTKDSYTCLHTIQSQKNFTCVRALNNNHIAAASNNVIQIYDITEGKYSQTPIKELICSNEIDNMYYIKNKHILIATSEISDDVIFLYNTDTLGLKGKIEKIAKQSFNSKCKYYILQLDEDNIILSSYHELLKMNLDTFKVEKIGKKGEVQYMFGGEKMLQLRHSEIILLTYNDTKRSLRTYNMETNKDILIRTGKNNMIKSMIAVDDNHIMTLSKENLIQLWKY